tara:strand:+ start:1339 stop:1728 length:390 start_codon:yes stop_codon:yes gene_type:complete
MSKRKPDQTITHRIELQTKERELIQDYMMFEQANKLIASLASMDIKTMYAWLNVAEALGFLDTPIPTVTDLDEIAGAVGGWATNTAIQNEQSRQEKHGTGFSLQDDLNYMIFRFFGGTREEWDAQTNGA